MENIMKDEKYFNPKDYNKIIKLRKNLKIFKGDDEITQSKNLEKFNENIF